MSGGFLAPLSRLALIGATVAALLILVPASAQTPAAPGPGPVSPGAADKPLWKELTRPQQVALEPLLAEWDAMDGPRKLKWLDIANRYASMKVDEQQRLHQRMRDWLKLTPAERKLVRENYISSKKIGKGDKSAQWEQYQALPEEEKRRLAAEAALKKQATQPARVAPPVKPQPATPAACPPGFIKNPQPAGAPCVPISSATQPAAAPALASPLTATAPAVSNAK